MCIGKFINYFWGILAIVLIFRPFPAHTQDSSQTSSVYLMEELSLSNYWDTGDLLWQIPGFWMRNLGVFHHWSDYSVNGQNLNQSQLYLDNIPLLNGWFDTPDLSWVPTSIIQSISHEPGSGQLSLKSISVPDKNPYTRILYRYGAYGYSVTDVTFGQKYSKRLELLAGVIFSRYAVDFLDYQNQKHKGNSVHVKLNYQISNGWNLQYQYIKNSLGNNLPFSMKMKHDTLDVNHLHSERYDHLFAINGLWKDWQVQTSLSHNTHLYDLYHYSHDNENKIPTSATDLNMQSSKRINQWTPYGQINLRTRSLKIPHEGKKRDNWGSIQLGSQFDFSSLIMMDLNIGSFLLPDRSIELTGSYKTRFNRSRDFKLDLSFSKDIRVPNPGERFGLPYYSGYPMSYLDGLGQENLDTFIPNEKLIPEKTYTANLDLNWILKQIFNINVSPFYQILEDPISPKDLNNHYQMTNTHEYHFLGFTSKIQLGPVYHFKLGTSLTALQAQDNQEENLLERPNFWSFTYLRWGHAFFENDLIVNLEASLHQWTEYYSLYYPLSDESAYFYHASQMLLNAKGTFRIMENLVFSYAIENILSEILYSPTGLLLPGRTSKISVTWDLYN